jgi:energy-converting hydrogenase Eha subunit A
MNAMRHIRVPGARARAARRQSLWAVFAWPLVIAALGLTGLIVALIGDGLHDVLAWIGLAAAILPLPWARATRRS